MDSIKIYLLLILQLFTFNNVQAKNNYSDIDSLTKILFVKAENLAIRERIKDSKHQDFFEGNFVGEKFIKITQKESPELITHTNKYKWGLLRLLSDKTLEKDFYTDLDIVTLLYNLNIDEYIEVIDSVFCLTKSGELSTEILQNIINQNPYLNVTLAKNYNYPPLYNSLTKIKKEIEFLKQNDRTYNIISDDIDDILSGKYWKDIPERLKKRNLYKNKNG